MKKLWSIVLIILAVSIVGFSQTETPAAPDWQTFAPENEEFSIDVPVSLDASTRELQKAQNPRNEADKSRRYRNTLNGTYFYIFSDDWKTPEQFTFAMNFGFNNQRETTQKSGDLTVTRYEFSDGSGFYHTIVGVRGTNRAYVFQTVSPTKDNPPVERFFKSIKFTQRPLLENVTDTKILENKSAETSKSNEPASGMNTLSNPELKSTTPAKDPVDRAKNEPEGFGIGNGKGNQTETNKVTAPLKILSKPRANYTDYARFYEIQGRVPLRITFSANGLISGITVISRLPFGLTEEAVKAARGLRFEPAMKEGIAYSVTKTVEYTFTIY